MTGMQIELKKENTKMKEIMDNKIEDIKYVLSIDENQKALLFAAIVLTAITFMPSNVVGDSSDYIHQQEEEIIVERVEKQELNNLDRP